MSQKTLEARIALLEQQLAALWAKVLGGDPGPSNKTTPPTGAG
jgi:hypothetical protein